MTGLLFGPVCGDESPVWEEATLILQQVERLSNMDIRSTCKGHLLFKQKEHTADETAVYEKG